MKALFNRMFRAMRFDVQLFDEVVADPSVQGQSVWAVAIFAMATAFGTFATIGGTAVNIGLLTTMLGWYVWAFSAFYFGTRFLKGGDAPADRKAVMRVMAYACAPGIIRLLGIVPKMTAIVLTISSIWILITAVLGLKRTFPESRTLNIGLLAVITWIGASLFQAILIVTLLSVFGVSKSGL